MPELDEAPPANGRWAARTLLRAARVGTLATQAAGQPFAGLVTPATGADLSPLLLLSDLSEHTRQLRQDPRCALLVSGPAAEANPQTAPRLTLTGTAASTDDPALRARYLAIHPYAALYAGFGDFHLWRIEADAGLFVGGFAQARSVRFADLRPDPAASEAVRQAAAGIIAHCNADHADALALLAGGQGTWRMVAVDADGCDLEAEGATRRVAWDRPAAGPDDVRAALIRLLRRARQNMDDRADR